MIATTTAMRRKSRVTKVRSRTASRSRTAEGSPTARAEPARTGDPGRCDPLFERRVALVVVTGRSCSAGRALPALARRSRVVRRCLFAMSSQGYGNGYRICLMPLEPSVLSGAVIALVLAVVGLAAWLALLQRSEARLRSRLRRILSDNGTTGLDEVLSGQATRIEQLASRVDALNALERELEASSRLALQKVGVVRFNPFQDSGGDQSFAIALLDQGGTGIVVSSLHGRAETRIFAKQVTNGRSKHALSDEEQQAIRAALQ